MTYFENLNSLPILSKLIYQQNGVQFKYLLRKPDMHMYFQDSFKRFVYFRSFSLSFI